MTVLAAGCGEILLSFLEKLNDLQYKPLRPNLNPDPLLIEKLVNLRGPNVPLDYIEFLRFFPLSGEFSRDDLAIDEPGEIKKTRSGRLPLSVLYGFDDGGSYDLIESNRYDDLFDGMIWIGADIFGNRFYLKPTVQSDAGGVCWFDFDTAASVENLISVAENFSEFVERLY